MAVFVVIGNIIFIPIYGINGAAGTTLILVVLFTFIRMGYVYAYFGSQPYGKHTLYAFMLIGIVFWGISFVHFNAHPMLEIALKSILITAVYASGVVGLKLSPTLDQMLQNRFKNFS